MTAPHLFVGIDIAAKTFTASLCFPDRDPSKPASYDQSSIGYRKLHALLAKTAIAPADTLIVLEATGTYWVTLATTMHALGYRLWVVNPALIVAHAKGSPRRDKDDEQDAKLIAGYGRDKVREVRDWTPPPQVYHELRQRLLARDSLLAMRVEVKNQLHALAQLPVQIASVREHLEQVIAELNVQVAALEKELKQVVRNDAWAQSAQHLMSITGVGLVTACWVLVATMNFTACESAEAAVHYAGLAPLKHESGTSVRGRRSLDGAGHGRLRRALYMATLSGVQHNAMLKTFYERLREKGKGVKVARCACARKLMHLCYAVVKKGCDFDPSYQKLPSSRWQGQELEVQIAA